jgi:hypothetical protein
MSSVILTITQNNYCYYTIIQSKSLKSSTLKKYHKNTCYCHKNKKTSGEGCFLGITDSIVFGAECFHSNIKKSKISVF